MSVETHKVEEFTRLVHDGRVVVLRPGETISMARAVELGLVKKPKTKDADK